MWEHANGVMLDMATIAKSSDSAIMNLAGVQFNIEDNRIYNEFNVNLNIKEAIESYDLKRDRDTMEWWQTRKREELVAMMRNPVPYADGINQFLDWITAAKPKMIWVHGAHFDIPILGNSIIKTTTRRVPWWNNIGDSLTFANAFNGAYELDIAGTDLSIERAKIQAQSVMDFFNSFSGE